MRKGWDVMKQRYLTQINELIDLCTGNFCEDIQEVIKEQCKNISDKDAEELKQYVEGFVKCCIDYGDILASEFKVPFLLRDDESERKIRKYTGTLLFPGKCPAVKRDFFRERGVRVERVWNWTKCSIPLNNL